MKAASNRTLLIAKRRKAFLSSLSLVSVTLRDIRDARGISQETLAKWSGVGAKTISTYETGARTARMSIENLGFICCALGITIAEFFDEVRKRILAMEVQE